MAKSRVKAVVSTAAVDSRRSAGSSKGSQASAGRPDDPPAHYDLSVPPAAQTAAGGGDPSRENHSRGARSIAQSQGPRPPNPSMATPQSSADPRRDAAVAFVLTHGSVARSS